MSFSRYPNYKDSGVEWLGEVPGHWKAVPIKHLGRLKGGAGFPHENQGIDGEELSFHKVNALAQADRDGFLAKSDNTINRATAKELGAFIFPPDSIVFAKVGAALLLGRIRMLNQDACLDNNMMGLVIRENEFHVKFVRHAMNLVRFDLIANPGAVPSLNEGQIGDFRLPMPPLPEQTQIAAFLDRETAKIDELVAEQRRLMELLKEKRQAVISHAVTRGLNPDVPLKPSGIEWLGDVPAHWEVSSFRHSISAMFNGLTADQVDESESTVPVTRIETISGGYITESRLGFIERENARDDRRLLAGDILFSNINSLSMIGNCAFYSGGREIYAGMNLLVFRPSIQRHQRWLYWLVRSLEFREVVESLAKPAINQASISQSSLNGIPVPIPPMNEQVEIAGYLEAETAKFDILTAEAQRAIDLLQERRTALISAAVTGQIDVRQLTEKQAA